MKSPALQRQRGMTLFVALVMLVLISLLAFSTFNLGKSSIQVVNNMQNRDQSIAASRRTLDEAISSNRFFDTPADSLASPCGSPNKRCHDINGDGVNDIVTTLTTPVCVKVKNLRAPDIDMSNSEDAACAVGVQQGQSGLVGAPTDNSLCADTTWEIIATSEDKLVQSKVEVVQGVAVRIPQANAETSCK